MGRLDGHRAVITGAASGIGEATARLFVAEGAAVVLADVDADRGQRIAEELGDKARFVATDVSEEADVDAAVAFAVEQFGGLDCMFNNAGNPGSVGGIEEIEMSMFDRTVAIHLRGVFLGIRAAARVMRPQGHGSIINTSSVAALGRQLRRPRLQRLQGGHRPSDPHDGQRARRAGHPGQCHLPRRRGHLDLRPSGRAEG